MKYFKSESGEVFAYESDGSQDGFIRPDLVPMTADEVQAHIHPPITQEQQVQQFQNQVQAHLDATAQTAGYDDIKTAVTYAEEPSVPRFQLEGRAFRAWRSQCWAYCYEQLAEVQAGRRTQPGLDEFLSELPALELTNG